MAHPAAPLLPEPLVVRGHLVTFDNGTVIEDGALYIDVNGVIQGVAPRASAPPAGFDKAAEVDTGGLVLPGADRPAQPHGLQLPVAVGAARPRHAVDQPRPVAAGPQLQAGHQPARQCPVPRRRQGRAQVRRDEGRDRRSDRDPGLGEAEPPVRGLHGPQRRVRDVPDRQEDASTSRCGRSPRPTSSAPRRRTSPRATRSSTTCARAPIRSC